jgi:hypothetical protein
MLDGYFGKMVRRALEGNRGGAAFEQLSHAP